MRYGKYHEWSTHSLAKGLFVKNGHNACVLRELSFDSQIIPVAHSRIGTFVVHIVSLVSYGAGD